MAERTYKCCSPNCPGRPYKASELAHGGFCHFEQNIAEIAEGLNAAEKRTLRWLDESERVAAGETKPLAEKGLAKGSAAPLVSWYRITPLGRQVAAVLRGEADRG